MKAPKTIPRSAPSDICSNYQALLRKGIQYCQELGGDLWTDYNEHDPGVTILEQLCYAITDLSYRTNFEVPDILSPPPGASYPNQALFTGDIALTCNPVTADDYRKVIYDRVKGVKNVWLTPIQDHPLGVQGLYDVLIETYEDVNTATAISRVKREVQRWMRATRGLGEDIEQVEILKPQHIRVEGIIEISAESDPVSVLAQVLFDIQHFLIPYPKVQLVDELFQRMPPDKIWDGPLLTHGALNERSGGELKSSIQVQDIINIILGVNGVKRVRRLKAGTEQGKTSTAPIQLRKKHVPRLYPSILEMQESYSISVELEGGVTCLVDSKAVWGRIQELVAGIRNSEAYAARSMKAMSYSQVPAGKYKNIENYCSIQHGFPVNYGLSKYGINDGLIEKLNVPRRPERERNRVARVRQLKAYLLFFEQLLTDYLAQLANVGKLFSLDEDLHQSYFYQPLAQDPPSDSEPRNIVDLLVQHSAGASMDLSHYVVCVLHPRGEIAFGTRKLATLAEAHEIRQQIIHSGQDNKSYRAVFTKAGEVRLGLYNAAGHILAFGQERFTSTRTANMSAERWTKFMIELAGRKQQLEKLVTVYRREDLGLRVIDDHSKIVLTSSRILTQEERERRILDILIHGTDPSNYRFKNVPSGGVRIQLLDANHELIAEGQERFITEFDAEEGVEDLIALLTRIKEQESIRDRHIQRLPEVKDVEKNPLRAYQEGLEQIARQTDHDYLVRRNRFLDHLLARFGERFDDGILQRLDLRPFGQKDDFYHELIQWKIEFLRRYVNSADSSDSGSVGAGKGQGFDYGMADGPNAISGLERRLTLLLGLHGHADKGKYSRRESHHSAGPGCFYLDKYVWPLEPEQVNDDEGARCSVSRHRIADSWPTGEPNLNDIHNNFVFSSEDSAVLRQVLSYGTNRKNYHLHAVGNEYRILLQTPHSAQSIEIHRAHSRAQAESAIEFLIADFHRIKENAAETYAGERLYVVEHILLRPHRSNLKHQVHISDPKNPNIYLKSDPLEREQKDEHLELILKHGQHASNYRIQRDNSGNRFLVLHHNDRPI